MKKRLLALGLGLVLAFAFVEAGLRIASALVDKGTARGQRVSAAQSEGTFRIICVGDSNTFGAGVAVHESYPSRLEVLLDESSSTVDFEVLNLGIPGSNSAQARNRLPSYLDRYDPDLLIVTIGVNDIWNEAETSAEGSGLQSTLFQIRTLKLLYLMVDVFSGVAARGGRTDADVLPDSRGERLEGDVYQWELEGGVRFDHEKRPQRLDEALQEAQIAKNLEAMLAIASQSGVPIALATYATNLGPYGVANRAMRQVGRDSGELLVSLTFFPDLLPYFDRKVVDGDRKGLFFQDLHPKAPTYDALARQMRSVLQLADYVPR